MAHVFVSIGSNIDREQNIDVALREMTVAWGELQLSSVYESDAVGFDSAPFYNLVTGFNSDESPRVIQHRLHAIEDSNGRLRTSELSARTLDLDLLLYGDLIMSEGKLVLPRTDIDRYAFVLAPLAEIAGNEHHPVSGVSYAELWAAFDASQQQLTRVDWPVAAN